MVLKKNDLILFQGDSVTDCNRNRNDTEDLGCGYAGMVAEELKKQFPALELRFQNRGICGDRTYRLLNRWEKECIELRPALLSILVGINDIWHRDKGTGSTDEEIEMNYDRILARTREALGDIPILVLEPFLTADHTTPITENEIQAASGICRRTAEKYGAVFVPLAAEFSKAGETLPPHALTEEGVHPTAAGHAIIAKAWMDAVQAFL